VDLFVTIQEHRAMYAVLLIPFLASVPLAVNIDQPPAFHADTLPPYLDMTVRGVMDSALEGRNVTFRVELDRRFYVSHRFPNGDGVELSGVLRVAKEGGLILDITIDGTHSTGRRECDSFEQAVSAGEKHLLCHGWVRWYEVTLVRAK
jgi:hypothetical protein